MEQKTQIPKSSETYKSILRAMIEITNTVTEITLHTFNNDPVDAGLIRHRAQRVKSLARDVEDAITNFIYGG